jgi:hypothetical protein
VWAISSVPQSFRVCEASVSFSRIDAAAVFSRSRQERSGRGRTVGYGLVL